MSDALQVEARDKVGSRNSMKLRSTGMIPAVLYGNDEAPVHLQISRVNLRSVLRHGANLVDLAGAATGQALLQDMQWDTFARDLLHVDLLRVKAGQLLHVAVPVELKGEAPGGFEGGLVEQVLREVEIEAPPSALPERLHIDVSELHMDGSMTVGQIFDLPQGAKFVTSEDEMVVHCVPPAGEPDEGDVAAEAGEPEVVGKKPEEEGEAEG